MGEARRDALRVDFDSRIKLQFHGASVTSDAGLASHIVNWTKQWV